MRIGFNPNKDKIIENTDFFHQVVVPVYIPNEEGYFKDSFTILQYCLNSLFKTSHTNTYFTIVNNGSCDKVVTYLNQLYEENKIHELIHTTNIGKLNAILKGIAGQKFSLMTITDADVLFLNNWQKAAYEIFETFPKTGAVSTTPNSKLLRYYTANIFFENLGSKALKFTSVKNPMAMKAFAKSIGNEELFNDHHLNKYLTVSKNGVQAVVGSGHFVVTYRWEIFHKTTPLSSNFQLGGESENELLDKPVPSQGYWKLSTEDNYTFHMGNVFEDWMLKTAENIKDHGTVNDTEPKLAKVHSNDFVNWFKIKIFSRILFRKPIWKLFLRYKGLTNAEAKKY